jgi:hypothetical protein
VTLVDLSGDKLRLDYDATQAALGTPPAVAGLPNSAVPGLAELAQATVGQRPTLVDGDTLTFVRASAQNLAGGGVPVIFAAGDAVDVWLVAAVDSTSSVMYFFDIGDSNLLLNRGINMYFHGSGEVRARMTVLPGGGTLTPAVTRPVPDGVLRLWHIYGTEAGGVTLAIDGAVVANDPGDGRIYRNQTHVALGIGRDGTGALDGRIKRVAAARGVTADERSDVTAYLAATYGIAI